MQQDDKLQKWHEGVDEVNVWVTKIRVKVESPMRLATDVDSALEQMDDFQVCCCYFYSHSVLRQKPFCCHCALIRKLPSHIKISICQKWSASRHSLSLRREKII